MTADSRSHNFTSPNMTFRMSSRLTTPDFAPVARPARWPAAGRRAASGATRLPAACLRPETAPGVMWAAAGFCKSRSSRNNSGPSMSRPAMRALAVARFPDRQARQFPFARQRQRVADRRLRLDRHRLRQRHGDLPDGEILQVEHAVDHRALVGREAPARIPASPRAFPRGCRTAGPVNACPPVQRSSSRGHAFDHQPPAGAAQNGRAGTGCAADEAQLVGMRAEQHFRQQIEQRVKQKHDRGENGDDPERDAPRTSRAVWRRPSRG